MENSVFNIILRRKNRVFINDDDMLKSLSAAVGEKNKQIVATMNKNIEVFGYTMSEALFDKLVHMKAILSWDLGKQHYGGIKNIMKHGGWESKIKTET